MHKRDGRSRGKLLTVLTAGLAMNAVAGQEPQRKPAGPPPDIKPHHRAMSGGGKRASRRAKARKRGKAIDGEAYG